MIRTIVTSLTLLIATTASADACGFFKKLTFGGHCSEAEYLDEKKANFAEGDEAFAIQGNYAYTKVGDEVIATRKTELISAYQTGGKDAVIELIGEQAGTQAIAAAEAFDEAAAKEASFKESIAELEKETGGIAEILDDGSVNLSGIDAIQHAIDNGVGHTIIEGTGGYAAGTPPPAGVECINCN